MKEIGIGLLFFGFVGIAVWLVYIAFPVSIYILGAIIFLTLAWLAGAIIGDL